MTRNQVLQLPCNEALFFRIVKTTFNQRRKMIRNSIKSILVHLDSDFELLRNRPEELGVSDFIELTRWVELQQSAMP
jgi:16S rRNA (adenine1518-N6/adenine1519-N6)-dimethyltransferase